LAKAKREFVAARDNPPREGSPEVEEARRAVADVERRYNEAEANDTGTCPTCGQPWDGPAEFVKKLHQERNLARARLTGAEERAKTVHAENLAAHKTELAELSEAGKTASAEAKKAVAALAEAEAAYETALGARADIDRWEAAVKALGDEPTVPEAPSANDKPDVERPTPGQYEKARKILADEEQAKGARAEAAKHIGFARADLKEARADLKRDLNDVTHYEKLVRACREAPSVRLRRNLAAFGNMGSVSIAVPSGNTAAAVVLIDGRPWQLASTGKQIAADAWLRAAVRRAYRMNPVPLFVDRVQDWTGDLEFDGPVVTMETRKDQPFSVEQTNE
jgi:DNA repair exonuclease SbcCD ATPase subunit